MSNQENCVYNGSTATFEGQARRMPKIKACLAEYGFKSLEEADAFCKSKGIDCAQIVKGIQQIAFENAVWAYTLGTAIALRITSYNVCYTKLLRLGTMDGANVEIFDAVGAENIITFGMSTPEVNARKVNYSPADYYKNNPQINGAINRIVAGFNGSTFEEIANSLRYSDPYMVLADFEAYQQAQKYASDSYTDKYKWNRMSLFNIANSGVFFV